MPRRVFSGRPVLLGDPLVHPVRFSVLPVNILPMSKPATSLRDPDIQVHAVAILGNPNTGKSTLFNAITGFRQHVGNYPGVTVERRIGRWRLEDDELEIDLVDLPGTYSLAASSRDEAIVSEVLLGRAANVPSPDVIVVVVDAANLARNLFLTTQLLELGMPVVVALNMVDLAESSGLHVDVEALGSALGVTVVPIVATKREGIDDLKHAILAAPNQSRTAALPEFPTCVREERDGLATTLVGVRSGCTRQIAHVEALQLLLDPGGYYEQRLVEQCGPSIADELTERRARMTAAGASLAEVEGESRYAWIEGVMTRVVTRTGENDTDLSDRVDRVLTHPVAGLVVLLAIMATCFQAVYTWAAPLMNAIDSLFIAVSGWVTHTMPPGPLESLIANGVVAGVGGVLVFLPQILVLFFFIAVLEDCGYMARAAFLLDRWMGMLGLTGKSFIPLLSSFACAVPGIMATRTIDNRRDRLVTMLIAPLMSCSARLPVYVLLIGAFIPATPVLGGFISLQAITLLCLYFVGVGVAIPVAVVLKKTVLKGETQSFLMELPTYKRPSPGTVFFRVYEQGREFCVSAGTIIFAVAIVIWALGYYPHSASVAQQHEAMRAAAQVDYDHAVAVAAATFDDSVSADQIELHPSIASALTAIESIEQSFRDQVADRNLEEDSPERVALRREADGREASMRSSGGPKVVAAFVVYDARRLLETRLADADRSESGTYLRESFLGRMGRFIEPAVRPLGWDWRIGTAVIASFPAREVVIATMGTIYNLGADQDETSTGLREKLRSARHADGRPVFNVAVALSVMVFFALCCQCAATLAAMHRETRSWRWPLLTFTYMTLLAYVAALITYNVASRFI